MLFDGKGTGAFSFSWDSDSIFSLPIAPAFTWLVRLHAQCEAMRQLMAAQIRVNATLSHPGLQKELDILSAYYKLFCELFCKKKKKGLDT
jgi:hypothetical protein